MEMLRLKKYLFLFCFLLLSIVIQAQNDVILKTDGSEMVGQVTAIEENDVKFTYKNETISYTVAKNKISKITFSSGRVEFYNKSSNLGDHHNKVAILPFAFIKNQDDGSVAMSKNIQQESFSIFNAKRGNLTFQDVLTTNRLLSKAGIGANDEQNYSMGELCDILGVEYVIQGLVSIEASSISSYSSTNTNIKTNNKKEARLESIRYVLSKFEYEGKGNAGITTLPDPNVAERYHRLVKQFD